MEQRRTTEELRNKIKRLQSDKPSTNSRVYYRNQKEHWLSWLNDYNNNGAYGRPINSNRDAKWVYNHVVCPNLLLYLIKSINIKSELVAAAQKAYEQGTSEMQASGAIRKIVPWSLVYEAIWGNEEPSSFLDKFGLKKQ